MTYHVHPSVNRVRLTGFLFQNRHSILPGLNLHSADLNVLDDPEQDLEQFYRAFPLKSTCPLPLLPPNNIEVSATSADTSVKLLKEKYVRKKKVALLKTNLRNLYKKDVGFKDMIDKVPLDSNSDEHLSGVLPSGVTKLALHYEDDPDPYFKGVYNWYYGSTLSAHRIKNEGLLLISAAGRALDELHLKIVKPGDQFKTETFVFSDQMVKGCPIYEVSSLRRKKFLAIRQRNRCAFLKFDRSENSMNTLLCIDSKVPFLNVDTSPFSKDEVCMIKANKMFQVWDVKSSTKNPKLTGQLPTDMYSSDNWCNLRYGGQPHVLLAADRTYVYLYDTRMDMTKPAQQWSPWEQCEACEEISLLRPSVISPVLCYVGTSHQMFSLDIRASFRQRWTHMMHSPPYIATCHRIDDMEYVLFASQFTPGVECIVNDLTSVDNPKSQVFPKSLPSVWDTYQEAKLSNVCSNPVVNCRFDSCTIGLSAVKGDNDAVIVFTNKSSGDIFYQRMNFSEGTHSNPGLEDSDIKILKEFEKKCHKKFIKEKKTLQVTHNPVNLNELVTELATKEVKDKEESKPAVEHNAAWQVSKSHLESCKDYLASRLLSVWDVKELPDWAIEPTPGIEPGTTHSWPKLKKKKKHKVKKERNEEGLYGEEDYDKKQEEEMEHAEEQKEEEKEGRTASNPSHDGQQTLGRKKRDRTMSNSSCEGQELLEGKKRHRTVSDSSHEGQQNPEGKRRDRTPSNSCHERQQNPERKSRNRTLSNSSHQWQQNPERNSRDRTLSNSSHEVQQNPEVVFTTSCAQQLGTCSPEKSAGLDVTPSKLKTSGRISPDMFDATYIIPDRFFEPPPVDESSTTSGFETDDTSKKREKRSKKTSKLDALNVSTTRSSSQKNISQDLENSVSLLDNVGLVLSPNLRGSSEQLLSASQQTSMSPPKERPVEIFIKKEIGSLNSSFVDENTEFDFLVPAATSTQAIPPRNFVLVEQGLPKHTSLISSPILTTSSIERKDRESSNEQNCTNSASSSSQLTQSLLSVKRKSSDSENSPKKNKRLSQSFTPGF